MRIALAVAAVLVTACGHSHDDYETFMACVADHTGAEGLTEVQAVATCLVDHIAEEFATLQECLDYVIANGDYPNSRMEACTIYLEQTQ